MEKLILVDGHLFSLKGEKLFNEQTKLEEKKLRYKYVRNYADESICYVIIENRFFKWYKSEKRAQEFEVKVLCKNSHYTYYYTVGTCNFVFVSSVKGEISIIGRSLQHIYDNLYKIGRFAYQIVDGIPEKLCECMSFVKINIRVEISAGEDSLSEMQAFQKEGKRWKKVAQWLPGNIVPKTHKSTNLIKK